MIAEIRSLEAEGTQTRPGPARPQGFGRFSRQPARGDHSLFRRRRQHGGRRPALARRRSGRRQLRARRAVGFGSEQPTRDIQLYDVTAEDLAFVGDPYAVSGKIKGAGLGATVVPVRLTERDSGRVLAQGNVNLAADGTPVPFELSYVPSEPGEIDVAIEVPPLPGETQSRQ